MVDLGKEDEQKLEEEIEKKIKALPVEERVKAVSLNHFLRQKKNLDKELEKELETLNEKYDKLTHPLISKSGDIIQGRPLSEVELEAVLPLLSQEDRIKVPEVNNGAPIPEYWLKALKNCPALTEDIQEKDTDVLKHLTKIDYTFDETVKTNFTINFHFAENNYFTNTELKKSFFFKEGEEIPEKTVGTEIQWKEGKNLTKKTVKKKQKNKKSGQQRVVTKEVDDESFFLFFNSWDLQGKKLEDLDEEEAEKIQGRLDIDFSIGQVLIEEVLPYSLEYYLGVKTLEGEDDEFEEEDIDEEDDEDDDDDDEEDSKPKGKKGGKKK